MSLHPRQLLKNSSWTLVELAVYPALMIVATPLFIRRLGIEEYGLWMLVTTIGLGMNLFNLGMGDTNIRMIAAYRARNSQRGMRLVFNHNLTLSVLLFLVVVGAGLLLAASGFVRLFYHGNRPEYAGLMLCLAVISAGTKFIELNNLAVFKAFERFDLSAKLQMVSRNSVLFLNIGVLLMGGGLKPMLQGTVAVNLLNIVLQLFVVQKQFDLFRIPSLRRLRFSSVYRTYNVWYWLQSIIGLCGFLADKLLVAWFTDVKTLGFYSIASLVGTQINNFFVSFGSFIFPRVAYKLEASKGIESLYYVTRAVIALPGWLLLTFLLVFGDVVFGLWLGAEVYSQSATFIRLYLVFQAAILLIIVPHQIINGSRDIRLNSLFEITMRTTHVLAMVGGHYLFGIRGIVYGLIFSTFLNIPFQYYFFHRYARLEVHGGASFQVILPVLFIAALAFPLPPFYQVVLVAGLVVSAKSIYFDAARSYSENFLVIRRFLTKLESK